MENDDNAWKKLSSGKWVSSNDSWFEQAKANSDQALGILDSCNITEKPIDIILVINFEH